MDFLASLLIVMLSISLGLVAARAMLLLAFAAMGKAPGRWRRDVRPAFGRAGVGG